MTSSQGTPLGAVTRGMAAGAAGTAAMTAAQSAYYQANDAEASTVPAEVAKRILRGVFHRPVDEDKTEALNNLMHWSYGTSWGAIYGLVKESVRIPALPLGLAFGSLVWAASLVQLPAMKLAPPVWEQEPSEIASELGFHLVYGAGVGLTYSAIGT